MSYDVDLWIPGECEECGQHGARTYVFESNYTSNLSGALYEAAAAFGVLKDEPRWSWFYDGLHAKKASEVLPLLDFTAAYLRENEERLSKTYNPENGWGTVERCRKWIERIADACREHPDATVSGSA